jgi:putative transposase
MQYRRAKLQGGSFFFTLVTFNRQRIFISDEAVDNLRAAFRKDFKDHPFNLDAIVILPEHIHCIWTLPSGDADFSGRWG